MCGVLGKQGAHTQTLINNGLFTTLNKSVKKQKFWGSSNTLEK